MFLRTAISITAAAVGLTMVVTFISGAWQAAVLGGAIALAGTMLGLVLCHRAVSSRPEGSIHRQTNRLMAAFVASMLVRLAMLAGSLAAMLLVLGYEPLAFVAAFFLVHLVTQVLEIRYVHRAGSRPASLTA